MEIGNFITILIFSILSLVILFFIKTRTTRVIALISSHLTIIFLFNIYLKSFYNFKEIVLLISIYSMVILYLISNNKSFLADITEEKTESNTKNILKFHLPILIMIIGVSIIIILIATTLPSINQIINKKNIDRTSEIKVNPLILPSHPVHITVKKFYLGKKFNDITNDSVTIALEKNQQKRARIKDSLSDNIILKRTSDIILIIVASMTTILILANKKINQIL